LAAAAERAGCDAVMAVPPALTRLSSTDLNDHFRAIADAVSIPLIVQDASGYVGQAIPMVVYIALLEHYGEEKIVFKPEASPIGPNLSALRDATGGRARIFEGSGGILLVDSYRRGIAGTMPGVDLLDGVVALWKCLARGDEANAYRLYFPISAIVALQLQAGLDGFLAIEKHLLVKRGLFANARRRRPYAWELDAETAAEVDRLFTIMQDALRAEKVGI
jgi:4-hydroxy-tetrahydrodipicolinate synthase